MATDIIKVGSDLTVDVEHGIVSGWGIVSTVDGEDYFDLNVDRAGPRKGEKIPEHIPHDTVIKLMVDVAKSGTIMPGNEMHAGPDSGHFVGLFYMDQDVAKAMGMTTKKTGLMVQYKPTPEVLIKFKDGTYTGFSIEGALLESELIDDG